MANKTLENLAQAFSGESQAYSRYLNFAKRADQEGYKQVARMFRAAAEGERIHASLHLNSLGGVRSTEENLKAAINGETEEFENMYPRMIEDAKAEEVKAAETRFVWANEVEKRHANEYKRLLDNLGAIEGEDYFVCSVCGNLEIGNIPEKCPVCGAPSEMFVEID